ncbi:MAG: fibrobacter succinogenes major paralogous domain-containing protein, partial [Bacteroidales bacterium]|nr:fibrobacter succinogenes major paralogous domain-containing protein [Bacteroidales bacterium]
QVWMAENLAYLPSVVGPETGSEEDPYYYVYGYDGTNVAAAKATDNYTTYGVLYNWKAAQAACPEGWHLPSDDEWTQLETYLTNNGYRYDGTIGGIDVRAKIALSLVANTGWKISSNEGAAGNTDYPEYINKSGFTALPGGFRSGYGPFGGVGGYGNWWSSTQVDSSNALAPCMEYSNSYVDKHWYNKADGFSVRCVQD